MRDALGDRMKRQYEDRTRIMLPRRTYTIIRIDGKAFHTYTRLCVKPFDVNLEDALNFAAMLTAKVMQGVRFAYLQSDEISYLLTDFESDATDAWFDGNLQKMVSVAASAFTSYFQPSEPPGVTGVPMFDARAFTIPDPIEVENYFIWRQQDATRNSIQSYGRRYFSHAQLEGLSSAEIQEKVFVEMGLNWNDLTPDHKRGRVIEPSDITGGWKVDHDIPVFTADRDYLRKRIPRHD